MRKNLTPSRIYAGVLLLGVAIGSILVAPSAAHVGNKIGHLWNKHLKSKVIAASAPKFLYGIGGPFVPADGESFGCRTASYKAKRPETAHIHGSLFWVGGAAGSTYYIKAAYSTDGGTNWDFAEPDWESAGHAIQGQYGTAYNQGLVQLQPGTTYKFGLRASHASGGTGAALDCKLTVEIGPRKGDSISEPTTAARIPKGGNLKE